MQAITVNVELLAKIDATIAVLHHQRSARTQVPAAHNRQCSCLFEVAQGRRSRGPTAIPSTAARMLNRIQKRRETTRERETQADRTATALGIRPGAAHHRRRRRRYHRQLDSPRLESTGVDDDLNLPRPEIN